jgi:uncharacterized membrane protein
MDPLVLAGISAALMGLASLFEKMSLKDATPLTVLTLRTVTMAVLLLAYSFFAQSQKEWVQLTFKTHVFIIVPAILAIFFVGSYFMALQQGTISRVVPIIATAPLFAVIFSLIFLGDPLSFKRMIGTVLIILGVILVR